MAPVTAELSRRPRAAGKLAGRRQASGTGQGPRLVLAHPGSCGNRGRGSTGDAQGCHLDENQKPETLSPCTLRWAGCGSPSPWKQESSFLLKTLPGRPLVQWEGGSCGHSPQTTSRDPSWPSGQPPCPGYTQNTVLLCYRLAHQQDLNLLRRRNHPALCRRTGAEATAGRGLLHWEWGWGLRGFKEISSTVSSRQGGCRLQGDRAPTPAFQESSSQGPAPWRNHGGTWRALGLIPGGQIKGKLFLKFFLKSSIFAETGSLDLAEMAHERQRFGNLMLLTDCRRLHLARTERAQQGTRVCPCTHACVCVRVCVYAVHLCLCMHGFLCVCMYVCVCTPVFVCTHVCAWARLARGTVICAPLYLPAQAQGKETPRAGTYAMRSTGSGPEQKKQKRWEAVGGRNNVK